MVMSSSVLDAQTRRSMVMSVPSGSATVHENLDCWLR
jgi:hypothetical protein